MCYKIFHVFDVELLFQSHLELQKNFLNSVAHPNNIYWEFQSRCWFYWLIIDSRRSRISSRWWGPGMGKLNAFSFSNFHRWKILLWACFYSALGAEINRAAMTLMIMMMAINSCYYWSLFILKRGFRRFWFYSSILL